LAVRTRLAELGHTDVRLYERGWAEWAADVTLLVERLSNYDKLVHTD
jgi:3-mercaptopyruvate sulfurtransferase SseA